MTGRFNGPMVLAAGALVATAWTLVRLIAGSWGVHWLALAALGAVVGAAVGAVVQGVRGALMGTGIGLIVGAILAPSEPRPLWLMLVLPPSPEFDP